MSVKKECMKIAKINKSSFFPDKKYKKTFAPLFKQF